MTSSTTTNSVPARTHVVVGDGITAVAFIENCGVGPGDTLVVLGQNVETLGRGVAYASAPQDAPWRFAYLLNSPADDIDPAFARWLAERWSQIEDTMRGRKPDWLAAAKPLADAGDHYGVNAPREFYGDFVELQVAQHLAQLRQNGVKVRVMSGAAQSIEEHNGSLRIATSDGQLIEATSVDIAPGGPANLRLNGDDGPFSVPSLFGNEDRIAQHILQGGEIFCIGGNASMLDVLRLCQSYIPSEKLRFVACAPDGEVPPPLVPRLPRKLTSPKLSTGHKTAQSFLSEVWDAIQTAQQHGDEMREIRAGFRAHFLEHGVAHYVADPQEARIVPATLRFWLRGGTRDTIMDLNQFIEGGSARMLKGFVSSIQHKQGHAEVVIRDSDGNERRHQTGFVVNCAGAGPGSQFDPLTEDLLARGLIEKCPVSKGLSVGRRCFTGLPNVRHLSPATTVIGDEVMAMPLYDAHLLRSFAERAYS